MPVKKGTSWTATIIFWNLGLKVMSTGTTGGDGRLPGLLAPPLGLSLDGVLQGLGIQLHC